MKICFYINTLNQGGAERVVSNLANFLASSHSVTVINSFKSDDEYFLTQNINHLYIDDNHFRTKLGRNISRIKYLRHYLKREKPDVAISFMAEPNFRLILSSFGLKTKIIISVRNDPKKEYKGLLGRIIGKIVLPFSNGCVFQTKQAMDWFPKRLKKKSTIILNPVHEKFFLNDDSETAIKQNIVTCGRLSKQKNHEMLIKAFSMIKDRCDDNLVIYGEGALKDYLKKTVIKYGVSDRVYFPGQVSDVPNAIKNAKCFVLSSDYEGMPNALMEAMALGLPCISTDCPCGGPKEIIDDGFSGLLTPVGDCEQMKKALLTMLGNVDMRNFLAKNAKETAKTFFNASKILDDWERYIARIADIAQ